MFELDGSRMRDHDALFAEFASKLDFPDYFGMNWPALSDCLEDMLWFDETTCFLIAIKNWDEVLADAPVDRPVLERILNDVGSNWGSLGYGGAGAKRIPFNTVGLRGVLDPIPRRVF
ncbi:barstar family protein [Actinoplanes sp. NPDC049118]|uniref:barstar family protein n=1 Tax=Actinoplanes sp. NPDC049118 TaxID=3155769 RepID=UPI0033FBF395